MNNLINLEKVKENTFNTLFTFIKTAPIDDVVYRFNKWFPTNVVGTSGKDCYDKFIDCKNGVSAQYQKEIRENHAATNCSEDEIRVSNLAAKQAYQIGMEGCRASWSRCKPH